MNLKVESFKHDLILLEFSDEARIKEEREAQLIEQETIFNKLRKIAHVPNVQGLIGYYEQLT